jgi:hypothetical protein
MTLNKFFAAIFFGLGALANALNGLAATIDFESLSHAGSEATTIPNLYYENGYRVSNHVNPQQPMSVWGTESPHFAGSTGVFSALGNFGVSASKNLLLGPGGPFSVTSIDLSPAYNIETTKRLRIEFLGVFQNFGSITQYVDVPWFFGFQTFSLTGFNNLRSLDWWQPYPLDPYVQFQFDNIVVNIPEPGGIALYSLGFLMLAARRPRQK